MNEAASFAFETSWGSRLVDGGAEFRLWAPNAETIELAAQRDGTSEFQPMNKSADGWWSIRTDAVKVGGGYGFRVNGDLVVPDPAARAQMDDVHGFSRLVDPRAYHWTTPDWKGRPWNEVVFYELHTGTFTPEGTFDGIIARLDYLRDVGVTAIELMPVAHFGGSRGWGYDGVYLYAAHPAYGGPEGLKRLVDAAHERGMMVFLDVVYNHFGPDGNYLNAYAPEFFHPEINTPWGAAIAYDEDPVRAFMVENALYWLNEYRLDGLRLDAIDAIRDVTDVPLVQELAARVREVITDRHVHITTEDARNITWHIDRNASGAPKLVSGEWNDDFHHCAHVLATNESEGYYGDYAGKRVRQMARSLAEGFVFQGEYSAHREHEVGHKSGHLPPTAFVNFIQNHDQIGNRAFGERLTDLASRRVVEVLQAILLLSPQVPLMFMGEEYGETNPFCFFTDFHGELGAAVREGRRSEFKHFAAFQDAALRELIPDPNSAATFEQCRIDWSALERPNFRRRLHFVKQLLALRRDRIVPMLSDVPANCGSFALGDGDAFSVTWKLGGGNVLKLFANLSIEPWNAPSGAASAEGPGELLFEHEKGAAESLAKGVLPAQSVVFLVSRTLQLGKADHV